MKPLWQRLVVTLRLASRRVRLWVATRLVKGIDGTVVSTSGLVNGTTLLGVLVNRLEGTPFYKGNPARVDALRDLVNEVAVTLLAAESLGVPTQELSAVQTLYQITQDRSRTRKRRQADDYHAAIACLQARLDKRIADARKKAIADYTARRVAEATECARAAAAQVGIGCA